MSHQGKARVLTAPEMKLVFKAAEMCAQAKRNIAILHCSFHLALRACEIRRLRLCDVFEADGKTLVMMINLLKTMTKGKKQRHVPLSNKKARAALLDYIDDRRKRTPDLDLNEPLFPSQKGGFFKPNTIVMLFRHLFNMAGLKDAKSHSGRRTFITLNYREGVDVKSLQLIAGHEDVNVTMGYIDDDPERLQKIAERNLF
jgi:integrase/recombinase XerD